MKPNYPFKPIGSLKSLSLTLGLSPDELNALTISSDDYYFLTRTIVKPDNSKRLTYDAKPRLKSIHEKISTELLKKVCYPEYLQGSLKGRDYLSNCKKHLAKKIIISEDATNFFPSISKKTIHEVFSGLFNFPNDVSDCLAELTTYKGAMVQGAKTSSYLANLALWEREYELATSYEKRGYTYTRYVDDITVSSSNYISKSEQRLIISEIYGMLRTINSAPNRNKHATMPNAKRQSVHRVNVNRSSPSISKKNRANIRAAVSSCEELFATRRKSTEYKTLYSQTMGRVCTMTRMHSKQGSKLKQKLKLISPIK